MVAARYDALARPALASDELDHCALSRPRAPRLLDLDALEARGARGMFSGAPAFELPGVGGELVPCEPANEGDGDGCERPRARAVVTSRAGDYPSVVVRRGRGGAAGHERNVTGHCAPGECGE